MKMLREKKAGKGKELARVKMDRQLKMAEIQKQKAIEQENARVLAAEQ